MYLYKTLNKDPYLLHPCNKLDAPSFLFHSLSSTSNMVTTELYTSYNQK